LMKPSMLRMLVWQSVWQSAMKAASIG